MSVIRTAILNSESDETVTTEGPVRTHTIEMIVETDHAKANASFSHSLLAALPALFSPHPENSGATCRKRRIKQDPKNPNVWHATIDYSTETPKEEDSKENPLEKRVIWSYTGNKITRLVDVDTDGEPVLNTAWDAPDPAVEVPRTIPVAQAVSNEAADPWSKKLQYEDKINSHSYKGCDPGTLRLAQIDATEETKNNTTYWKVTYRFEYKRDGWQPRILNQGMNELEYEDDGVTATKKRILDANNQQVTVPWPLDADGIAFSVSELEGGQKQFLDINGYYEADFNNLGI